MKVWPLLELSWFKLEEDFFHISETTRFQKQVINRIDSIEDEEKMMKEIYE
jgi:hypothetical protein